MSSVLDIDLTMDTTLEVLDEGEYDLQIIDIEPRVSNNTGNPYLNIRTEAIGEPSADDVYLMISLPNDGDTEKQVKRKVSRLQDFVRACGEEPGTKFDYRALVGEKFSAILGQETYEGRTKNVVKEFVIPA